MKTLICLLPIGFLFFKALAMETNIFFVTDDGFAISGTRSNHIVINPKKLALAKSRKDSLPAEAFTEGNWGPVQNGFQLSLRIPKTNFNVGEDISADLLLRNVTNTILVYNSSFSSEHGGPIGFVLYDENEHTIRAKNGAITVFSSNDKHLYPGTQHEYLENINRSYDFTNTGFYTVYARLKISCPDCQEIQSAKIKIHIINQQSNKSDRNQK